MEILDRKSDKVLSFFARLDEVFDGIEKALQNRTPNLNGEKFLTTKEACRTLNLSARTLQEWKTRGKIPFIQLGGKILYRQSDIDKILTNGYSA